MAPDVSIWLVIVLALVAANLPFANERLLAVVPLPGRHKALGWRVIELLVWYFVVGAVGMALEKSAGQNYPQGWEFYAVTGSLFATLAFPGFVYRYLVRHKK